VASGASIVTEQARYSPSPELWHSWSTSLSSTSVGTKLNVVSCVELEGGRHKVSFAQQVTSNCLSAPRGPGNGTKRYRLGI
jgi:hypothetical protein